MVIKKTGCPVDNLLKLLGQRWSSYILWVLQSQGAKRFGELKRQIPGISQKVLTDKLRELEAAQLVHRDYQPTIPPTVTYSLAPLAKDLRPILAQISDLAHLWRERGLI
jgi:DNA-binding HxlR family transcriptional regulator